MAGELIEEWLNLVGLHHEYDLVDFTEGFGECIWFFLNLGC